MNYAERNVKCAEQGSLRNIWNVNYAERNVKCTEQGSLRNMARAELRLWPAACLTLPCSTHNICHKSRILFASLTIFLTIYAIYLLHTHYLLQNLKHICYAHNICTKVCKIIASNTIYITICAMYLLHTQYLSQYLQFTCFTHNICHKICNIFASYTIFVTICDYICQDFWKNLVNAEVKGGKYENMNLIFIYPNMKNLVPLDLWFFELQEITYFGGKIVYVGGKFVFFCG